MSEYQIWKMKQRPKLSIARKNADNWFKHQHGYNADYKDRDKITVNYIRHAFTHYNSLIARLSQADPENPHQGTIEEVRRRVYTEISDKYPDLQAECERQMVTRLGEDLDGRPRSLGDPTPEESYHDEIDARKRAKAEHDRTITDAPAERDRVITAAKTELDRVIAEAHKEFRRAKAEAIDECKRVTAEADDERDRTIDEAHKEFRRAKAEAIDECKRVTGEDYKP